MAWIEKRGNTYRVQYRDAAGRRLSQGGFRTKADAKDWAREREAEQRAGLRVDRDLTFRSFAERYLAQHHAADATITRMRYMLALAYPAFGDTPLVDLTPQKIGAWYRTVSEGSRWNAMQAVKQVLKAAVEWRVLPHSPAASIKNPRSKPKEFVPLESWAQVQAIEEQMPLHYFGLVTFCVGTGMRPQEWTKLRWEHVDLDKGLLTLPASITKDHRPRTVPLRDRVVQVLRRRGPSSGLVFTAPNGGPVDITNWRPRVWEAAQLEIYRKQLGLPDDMKREDVKAIVLDAGLPIRRPYDMRHTYATWALRAGMNTFALARRMGTSLEMIDRTYGHFATDSEDHERGLLDAFDIKTGGLEITVGGILGAGE